MFEILKAYIKWRKNWDGLCSRCGLCCYDRSLSDTGRVAVDFASPCMFLNKQTRQCRVFEKRFKIYPRCKRVTLYRAVFYKYLPESCAYARTFRPWKYKR